MQLFSGDYAQLDAHVEWQAYLAHLRAGLEAALAVRGRGQACTPPAASAGAWICKHDHGGFIRTDLCCANCSQVRDIVMSTSCVSE